jgi:hypothetical protein
MTHIVAINCYVFFTTKPCDNLWRNIIFYEIYDRPLFSVHAKPFERGKKIIKGSQSGEEWMVESKGKKR